MYEYAKTDIKCPFCDEQLEKVRYKSKGNWVTWWRIKCNNKSCEVDTGMQSTLSVCYEALMTLYYNAKSIRTYTNEIPETNVEIEY